MRQQQAPGRQAALPRAGFPQVDRLRDLAGQQVCHARAGEGCKCAAPGRAAVLGRLCNIQLVLRSRCVTCELLCQQGPLKGFGAGPVSMAPLQATVGRRVICIQLQFFCAADVLLISQEGVGAGSAPIAALQIDAGQTEELG